MKKIISIVLSVILIFTTGISAFAADISDNDAYVSEQDAGEFLDDQFSDAPEPGDGDGNTSEEFGDIGDLDGDLTPDEVVPEETVTPEVTVTPEITSEAEVTETPEEESEEQVPEETEELTQPEDGDALMMENTDSEAEELSEQEFSDGNEDAASAGAKSGTCGDKAGWNLKGTVLTITGSGAMTDYGIGGCDENRPPWYDYRESITKVVIGTKITTVGAYSFWEFRNIRSIALGNNLTSVLADVHLTTAPICRVLLLAERSKVLEITLLRIAPIFRKLHLENTLRQ